MVGIHYPAFLQIWSYTLNGKVTWEREDGDTGVISVVDNIVKIQ